MPTVYIRPEVLVIEGTSGRSDASPAPDREGAIAALGDCGWDVVVLGEPHVAGGRAAMMPDLPHVAQPGPGSGAWLVTTDVGDCRWARRDGLRTILVSADHSSAGRPERCDLTARSLFSAALEIMSRDDTQP